MKSDRDFHTNASFRLWRAERACGLWCVYIKRTANPHCLNNLQTFYDANKPYLNQCYLHYHAARQNEITVFLNSPHPLHRCCVYLSAVNRLYCMVVLLYKHSAKLC